MTRRSRSLALSCAAALVALAGCGGDDATTDATQATTDTAGGVSTDAGTGDVATTAPASTLVAAAAEPPGPATMIVDTDLAADDIVALSYLTSHPDVEVGAVTVSGTGEVTCPRGARIAHSLMTAMGEADVPVACGSSSPMSGDRAFPDAWRTAADAAWGLLLMSEPLPPDQPTAVDLLADSIGSASEPVTVLTLGPLTNLAEALAAEPGLASKIDRVVVMGGAVSVPGNVYPDGASEPLAAEWNLYVDPVAAATVFGSGLAITLVALDATNAVPMNPDVVRRLAANDTNEQTARVLQLFDRYPPEYLWDPLAAIAAAEPGMVPVHSIQIGVVTTGDQSGQTRQEPGGARIDVADPPAVDAVLDHLLRTLAGVPEGEALVAPTTLPVLGQIGVSFDGTTCVYDGPSSLASGAYAVTTEGTATEYVAAIAHLVAGATVEETMAWVADHPEQQPPMVDDVAFVGGWAEPSPATVVLAAGTVAVVCGSEDGAVHLAGTIDVGE